VKKIVLISCLSLFTLYSFAQDSTVKQSKKAPKKEVDRQRINTMMKQEEEGVLVFSKQTVVGIELRTNGYGAFLELGRMKTPRWTNIYSLELTEIKNPKEEKLSPINGISNSYVYAKQNNFYQAKLGYGRQYIFGQKGNKNGVAVIGILEGGFSLGLLKPYYLEVSKNRGRSPVQSIKFTDDDTAFLGFNTAILGASGFTKGWGELKFKPGLLVKTALRFDFGRYNESIQAIEIGLSVDAYSEKIPIMALGDNKQFFYQGHVAFVFGKRK